MARLPSAKSLRDSHEVSLAQEELLPDGRKPFEVSPYSENIFYHHEAVKSFTPEEVEEANRAEAERNEAALEQILADGFIELPIFFRNVAGDLVERKAWVHPTFTPSNSEGFFEEHGMRTNIYVPSYKRAGNPGTIDMLQKFGAKNWYLAIDPDQYEEYKKHYPIEHFLIRDIFFRDGSMIDLCSSVLSPNSFHGTAGIYNNLLAFSRSLGEEYFWTMDDDIIGLAMKAYKGPGLFDPAKEKYEKENFYRCSNIEEEYGFNFQEFMASLEEKTMKCRNPSFTALEKFGLVFNLPVMWKLGTRSYSFYLTKTATQVNHIGQHNNDVNTSLELSKHGYTNMLFEGISYNSLPTQAGGGLTELYKRFGTLDKGRVLVRCQPNYTKITVHYSRIHHSADYNSYNKQRMVGAVIPEEE